jgi:hypothetical protein
MEIKNFTLYVSVKTQRHIYIKNTLYIHPLYIYMVYIKGVLYIYIYICIYNLYIYGVYIQSVVHPAQSLYIYIQSGPKKCIHSLLVNTFGINLNEISILG